MRRCIWWRSALSAKFSDRRRRFRCDGWGHAVGVSTAELVANRPELALLELANRDATPAIRGADDGGVDQFEHRALAEGVRDDLGAPALFEEEPLEEIRRPDHFAMPEWKAELRDAGVEILEEPGHERRMICSASSKDIVAREGRFVP
jgi:hypothetical protein